MKGLIKITKKQTKKIAIIGTDKRLYECKRNLIDKGFDVNSMFAEDKSRIVIEKPFEKCIDNSRYVILGAPITNDGKYLNSGSSSFGVSLDCFFEKCRNNNTVVLAGTVDDGVLDKAKKYGVKIYDYLTDEAYLFRNAKTTATASLFVLMNSLDISPHSAEILIFGYGKVGFALSEALKGVGASVTVCARSRRDLSLAQCMGYDTVDISCGIGNLPYCDAVFNTVPSVIFDCESVKNITREAIVIELASAPGGFDKGALEMLGDRYIKAAKLPGKVFPKTAGEDLCEVCVDIMQREGTDI